MYMYMYMCMYLNMDMVTIIKELAFPLIVGGLSLLIILCSYISVKFINRNDSKNYEIIYNNRKYYIYKYHNYQVYEYMFLAEHNNKIWSIRLNDYSLDAVDRIINILSIVNGKTINDTNLKTELYYTDSKYKLDVDVIYEMLKDVEHKILIEEKNSLHNEKIKNNLKNL